MLTGDVGRTMIGGLIDLPSEGMLALVRVNLCCLFSLLPINPTVESAFGPSEMSTSARLMTLREFRRLGDHSLYVGEVGLYGRLKLC